MRLPKGPEGAIRVVALMFLAFVVGAIVVEFKLFPYRQIFKRPFAYARAQMERSQTLADADGPAPASGRVTVAAAPEAFAGYTFLTYDKSRPSTARLIDMQGRVVHEWHRPFKEIWPDHPQSKRDVPEEMVAWRYAELQPNGDVITTVKIHGESPEGSGIVKLDRDSKVVWSIPAHVHHQFSVASDGQIFALAHQWRDTEVNPVPGAAFLPDKTLEDFVLVLSPDGKELSRISLLEAMSSAGWRELFGSAVFNGYDVRQWDRLHPNDVKVIDEPFAARHPFMKPGMLLLSFRDLDALAILDPASKQIVWTTRGPWLRQHDPDLLPSGNVLLFDNRGNQAGGGASRVLEVDPATSRIVWSYAGTAQTPFESVLAGGQQRLPNGNTLISEDYGGRIFEVTTDRRIVWEYQDVRCHHASRVAADWLKFTPARGSGAPATN